MLGAERYKTIPHVTANLDPMASAAALVAWEEAAPVREAERAEQQRRAEAADQQARLHSPDPEVRERAQRELAEALRRWHRREPLPPAVRSPHGTKVATVTLSPDDTALLASVAAMRE